MSKKTPLKDNRSSNTNTNTNRRTETFSEGTESGKGWQPVRDEAGRPPKK